MSAQHLPAGSPLRSPLYHCQYHLIITERKGWAFGGFENHGSAPVALGSHLTAAINLEQWPETGLHCAPSAGLARSVTMGVTQSPICQRDVEELARATETMIVTLASLWHADVYCLCSAAPEGKGGVEDGDPKAVSLGGLPSHQNKVTVAQTQTCCALALSPVPIHCGGPVQAP